MSVVLRTDTSWKCLGYPDMPILCTTHHVNRALNSLRVAVDGFDRTALGSDWGVTHYDGTGSVSLNGRQVQVSNARSGDFTGTSDTGSLIYRLLPQEWSAVEVDVTSLHELTSAVRLLMVRESLLAGAAYYAITLDNDASHVTVLRREAQGTSALYMGNDTGIPIARWEPLRLRIERLGGDVLVAKVSSDGGLTWRTVDVRQMPQMSYACLCASGTSLPGYVLYDNFSLEVLANGDIEATPHGLRLRDGATSGESALAPICLYGLKAQQTPVLRYDVFDSAIIMNRAEHWAAGALAGLEIGSAGELRLQASTPKFRRMITLSSPTPYPYYQVRVRLTSSTFDYSKAKSDGADIRFVDFSGHMMPYWIESWNPGGTSDIWVRVPTEGTLAFYMTYGDPNAVSQSDGKATFLFFDDFDGGDLDTDIWHVADGTAYTVADGVLQIRVGGIALENPLPFSLADGYAVEVRVRHDQRTSRYGGTAPCLASSRFTQGSTNTGADAVALLMRNLNATSVHAWIADGRSASYNIANAASLWTSSDASWERTAISVEGSTLEIWHNGRRQQTYSSIKWEKDLRFVSLGAYYEGLLDIQDTSYDFVFIRRYASSDPSAAVGPEQTLHLSEGTWVSPVLDLSPAGVASLSRISWQATTPIGSSVRVESNLSLDGGQTWMGWQSCADGGAIPDLVPGTDLSNARLQIRQVLDTMYPDQTPELHSLFIGIVSDNPEKGVAVDVSLSLDGGANWSGWQTIESGASIHGLAGLTHLDQVHLKLRVRMTQAGELSPLLSGLGVDHLVSWFEPGYDDSAWQSARDNGAPSSVSGWAPLVSGWPDDSARWVWDRASTSSAPAGNVYFRNTFSLVVPSPVTFVMACDEAARVYVDGVHVGSCYQGMSSSTIELEAGEHVVAVEACNTTGGAGFLLTAVQPQVRAGLATMHARVLDRIQSGFVAIKLANRLATVIRQLHGASMAVRHAFRSLPTLTGRTQHLSASVRPKRTITSQIIIYGLYMLGGREGTAETRGRHAPFTWEPFTHSRWHQTPKYREGKDDGVLDPGEQPPGEEPPSE